MSACLPGVPVGLTIPKEQDEVFGLADPGLDFEGGFDGCSCLLVPEGWHLLLRWDSANTHQSQLPSTGILGHLCRVPTFQGYSFPGHSHAEASSHVDQVVQGAIWGGGRPFKLAPTAWPQGPGAGNKGGSKTRHDGALSGEWDGAKSMVGGGDTGYRHFPQTSPQHRSK